MSLAGYLHVFRRRWIVLVGLMVVAAIVTWIVTPSQTARSASVPFTATATLLVDGGASASRVALFITNGEVPKEAAQALDFDGDPVGLAAQMVVTPNVETQSITISSTMSDAGDAEARANTFADETVAYFHDNTKALGGVSVTILQRAVAVQEEPSGLVLPPNRLARAGIAALLGLLFGMALALILERLDTRLRTRDQVAERLKVPVIAEIPRLPRMRLRKGEIEVFSAPLSRYSDAYRSVRASVSHSALRSELTAEATGPETTPAAAGDPTGGITVLITSAFAGEGKTTSAVNIAACFAETDQRVLVFDADLRSPDVHNAFELPQRPGVSNYLLDAETTDLAALIGPTKVPNVSVLSAGTLLDRPESLAARMAALIDQARAYADVVVIDTAPFLVASETYDLIPVADTVLLVVKSGSLTTASGDRVAEALTRFSVPVNGVVLIAPPLDEGEGYGYRYGYGYGYGYGYRRGYGYRHGSRKRFRGTEVAGQDLLSGASEADAVVPTSHNAANDGPANP